MYQSVEASERSVLLAKAGAKERTQGWKGSMFWAALSLVVVALVGVAYYYGQGVGSEDVS